MSPTTVAAGGTITVTASGFAASTAVQSTFDGLTLSPLSHTSTSSGSVSISRTLPGSLTSGSHDIRITGDNSGGGDHTATGTFTISSTTLVAPDAFFTTSAGTASPTSARRSTTDSIDFTFPGFRASSTVTLTDSAPGVQPSSVTADSGGVVRLNDAQFFGSYPLGTWVRTATGQNPSSETHTSTATFTVNATDGNDDNGNTTTTSRPCRNGGGGGDDDNDGGDTSDCHGEATTIEGTDGDDRIRGTSGRDVIDAGPGDDVIKGLDGKDIICGGQGKDRIDGGDGDDKLYGGSGKDKIFGGDGNDLQKGGEDDDSLSGGNGNDEGNGGNGNDRVSGGRDDDVLAGDDGVDSLIGGSGEDHFNGGNGDDRVADGTAGSQGAGSFGEG